MFDTRELVKLVIPNCRSLEYTSTKMKFTWSVRKESANIRKHNGVTFTEAATVFNDSLALVIDDPDHSQHELRFLIIGRSSKGNLLVVSHTEKQTNEIRIISARLASPREKKDYENG
jgi:uncharacterized protein